jgi:predicted choloylglycine hydrolase
MKIGNAMNKQIHLTVGLKINDKLLKNWENYIHPKAWQPIYRKLWAPIQDITYPTLIINNITL